MRECEDKKKQTTATKETIFTWEREERLQAERCLWALDAVLNAV